jgi:hypothetical protein
VISAQGNIMQAKNKEALLVITNEVRRRFFARVKADDLFSCHIWQGAVTGRMGYGQIMVSGITVSVHRLAYVIVHGSIPDGMCLLHTCDNPRCVNPAHLIPGTKADNNRDKVAKHRSSSLPGESNPAAKLTNEDVIEIRKLRKSGLSGHAITKLFPVGSSQIKRILRGECFKNVT